MRRGAGCRATALRRNWRPREAHRAARENPDSLGACGQNRDSSHSRCALSRTRMATFKGLSRDTYPDSVRQFAIVLSAAFCISLP